MTDEIKGAEDNVEGGMSVSLEIEMQLIRQWESIGICNDFVFCKIMQDRKLLAELIRLILPDLKFRDIDVQAQRSIEIGPDIHGVRFDIFVTLEDGSIVEIEMQVLDTGNLPKRLRFYGSLADTQMPEKGMVYSKLRDSFVIMICPFDVYGEGRHIYTFTNRCREDHKIEMGDGSTKIVLNVSGYIPRPSGAKEVFISV